MDPRLRGDDELWIPACAGMTNKLSVALAPHPRRLRIMVPSA
jgi:hypothetical protein